MKTHPNSASLARSDTENWKTSTSLSLLLRKHYQKAPCLIHRKKMVDYIYKIGVLGSLQKSAFTQRLESQQATVLGDY